MLNKKEKHQVKKAASILQEGGIVAFPTETVYGLGAVATNPKAIRRVYQAKQRPLNHPVIVHISQTKQLLNWAKCVDARAQALISAFWPGPLTLILPRTEIVLDDVTGGQDTVAIRMPANKLALALIEAVGQPIIAPSANRFGHLSPTHSDHIKKDLDLKVDFVIEGGYCEVGMESTIVDLSSPKEFKILRFGAIMPSQIERILGVSATTAKKNIEPRVPGALLQHYAPISPFLIIPQAELEKKIQQFKQMGKTVAVLSQRPPAHNEDVFWLQMPIDSMHYMQIFYHSLFLADQKKPGVILAETLPDDEEWLAIQDRMMKAVHVKSLK